MVQIENIDEFNSIKESNYGFVVEVVGDNQIIHKTKCQSINSDNFIDSTNQGSEISYHWFSTIALVEKSFSKATSCEECNPD